MLRRRVPVLHLSQPPEEDDRLLLADARALLADPGPPPEEGAVHVTVCDLEVAILAVVLARGEGPKRRFTKPQMAAWLEELRESAALVMLGTGRVAVVTRLFREWAGEAGDQ